jgi:hypothetical protein
VNVAGIDRGLGLTFSHDHYGPSTFQQIGLYSTILAEPAGSSWAHNESGEVLGTRHDGGPTTWQAVIDTTDSPEFVGANTVESHREFYFEMSDFQHAYEAGVFVGAGPTGRPSDPEAIIGAVDDNGTPFNATDDEAPNLQATWQQTVNPPLKRKSVPFPDVVTAEAVCPGGVARPCAEAINISHSSMFVVNYRNEPVGLRVFDPNKLGPDGTLGSQAGGLNEAGVDVPLEAGDLAFALQSRRDRAIPQLNTSFGDTPYPSGRDVGYCQGNNGDLVNCDRNPGDPFTPIMRAYENDQVKIKIQVGATEEQHQATVHGMKWLSNGSGFGRSPNSGWRNFQSHGISEQFSLQVPVNPDPNQRGNTVDYLYATDATRDGMWLGSWGVLRSYGQRRQDLEELPNNPQQGPRGVVNANEFNGVCPNVAPVRPYDVTAVLANDVLPNNLDVNIPGLGEADPQFPATTFGQQTVGGPLKTDEQGGGTLVYNRRTTNVPPVTVGEAPEPVVTLRGGDGPLNDPTAMMYVRTTDLVAVDPAALVCSLDPAVNPNAVDTNLDGIPDTVVDPATGSQATSALQLPRCPVRLADNAPVEPIVLRANAGDCIETVLRNRLPFTAQNILTPVDTNGDGIPDVNVVTGATFTPEPAPDLAGWQDMMWLVKRNIQPGPLGPEMHFFNNNLIRPSSHVGLHAQLVEYDASRHDGLLVGGNTPGGALAPPGGAMLTRWYAGDLSQVPAPGQGNQRNFEIVATPIEFGGTNLLSADRIKQPQKGLFGALVIEPEGATWPDALAALDDVPDGQGTGDMTRKTRAQVTVNEGELAGLAGEGGEYREALAIGHKIANLRWADGTAINVNQGELGREGAEDSGHAGFNYGMEPSWFRFQLPPDVPFGNAGAANSYGSIANVHALYANGLADNPLENAVPAITGTSAAGDPLTPVFRATRGQASRVHVLNGASADRDGTFILHGHLWQRDPFVCPGESDLGLIGRCEPSLTTVDSTALGFNQQGKWMGGEEGMGHVYGHWPILFNAGGTGAVPGDYLFRDYAPNGNRNGQFGILRVE